MSKPKVYRTSDGRVFQDGQELKLHNGFWWWDVGCAVAPEGAEANLPLWDHSMSEDPYYKRISDFYKDKHAKRSGVAYIDHIDQGTILADHLGYSLAVKQAFCLHPMFQADQALEWAYKQDWIYEIDPYVMMLTIEYRKTANGYVWANRSLKQKDPADLTLSPIPAVNEMLVMDKVQNRKDFELYHLDSHEQSEQLHQYFKTWTEALGVADQYEELKALIS